MSSLAKVPSWRKKLARRVHVTTILDFFFGCPVRLVRFRTPGFHPGNRGSNPLRDAKKLSIPHQVGFPPPALAFAGPSKQLGEIPSGTIFRETHFDHEI